MEEQSVGSRGSEVSAAGLFRIIGHHTPARDDRRHDREPD
jgi:hypothetical protein